MNIQLPSPLQELKSEFLKEKNIELWVKRDDLIHPHISGNKWRKLKYNIEAAKQTNKNTLLTFGGAFSNHIVATAAACAQAGLKSIGIIRGEEPKYLNQTLQSAKAFGMHLHFISRSDYRLKTELDFIESLHQKFGAFCLVPEGGFGLNGAIGCSELLKEVPKLYEFTHIASAMGTGTTTAGLLLGSMPQQQIHGFSALKGGEFLRTEVESILHETDKSKEDQKSLLNKLELQSKYHFGGYAKIKPELVDFVNDFYKEYKLPLDLVYTGKMMYGLMQMIDAGYFQKGAKILTIHTGGLQGNQGFKERFGVELSF